MFALQYLTLLIATNPVGDSTLLIRDFSLLSRRYAHDIILEVV